MKAYEVSVDDSDKGCSIVFAENRNQAKVKALSTDACEDERYIDIRVKRLPAIDGMENHKPKDNYWLDDEIRTILVREYGWRCFEPDRSDCEICSAKEYCGEYEDDDDGF